MQHSLETEPLLGHRRYHKVKEINRGSFGFVQLAKDIVTGELVAVKFLERGSKITKYVEREIWNHSHLLHPHVIQFKEVFLTGRYLAIVMEYAPGGDLYRMVVRRKGLPEVEARWFFQQLILGLDYCHRMGVVNRDIKLENTLLDGSPRPLLKICDFGYSKSIRDSVARTKVGTPSYAAPEVIANRNHYDGRAADVWSCGVALYVILFCAYPFEDPLVGASDGGHVKRIMQRIVSVDYRLPAAPAVSRACRDLLSRILVGSPEERITIAEIEVHPWFRTELPPGVLQMNEACLSLQATTAGTQSERDILSVLRAAKTVPGQEDAWASAAAQAPQGLGPLPGEGYGTEAYWRGLEAKYGSLQEAVAMIGPAGDGHGWCH